MEKSLPRARDVARAQSAVQAVIDGNHGRLRALLDDTADCGLMRADVEAQAIAMNGADADLFAMLNLHPADKPLNAALYFATYRGEGAMVTTCCITPFDQASLDVALFGAVAAGEKDLAVKLIDLGADASCGDGACVEAAIRHQRDDIAKLLLAAGKSYTAALAAYIDQGRTEHVIDLLAEGAAPLDALKSVCRQLSEYSASRDHLRDRDYNDAFDIIFSYAMGHGDDIPQLLHDTMTYATDRGAVSVVDKIIAHPDFAALPSRQSHLDAALAMIAGGKSRGLSPFELPAADLAEKLFALGANPQVAFDHGAPAGAELLVREALKRGADPRLNGRRSIRQSFNALVRTMARAAENQLNGAEAESFLAAGPLTVERLRAIAPGTTRSGLLTLASAGKMAQALEVFRREDVAIAPADLSRPDAQGWNVLEALSDRGEAGVLLDPQLWLMRERDYADVVARLPQATQESLRAQHQEVQERLSSHRITQQLKEQAEAHRRRLRPK